MFVKIFGSILDSSIWAEDIATKILWITMLAMADEHGFVNAAKSGLARRAGITPEQCEKALTVLEGPDPESKSQEYEGRRIEKVDGGWVLLNYEKYRAMQSKKQIVDAARQSRKRKRDRESGNVTGVTCHDVTVEAEAEAEAEKILNAQFERFWEAKPKRSGSNPRKPAQKAFQARVKDGVDPEVLIAGAKRWRAYCDATGQTGTQYVKQVQFWLSPTYEGWSEPWDAPSEPMSSMSIDPSKVVT